MALPVGRAVNLIAWRLDDMANGDRTGMAKARLDNAVEESIALHQHRLAVSEGRAQLAEGAPAWWTVDDVPVGQVSHLIAQYQAAHPDQELAYEGAG